MHELGIVFYIIKDVKEVAQENLVQKVSSVTLQIGEVSGILFDYLEDCWNWAVKKEPVMDHARLICEKIDAVTLCRSCGCKYPTVRYGKICPECHSPETHLLQGNEVSIKEIEAE